MPTLDDISKLFNLRLKDAANKLDISVSKLKSLCRTYGIVKWPFRMVTHDHFSNDSVRGCTFYFEAKERHDRANKKSPSAQSSPNEQENAETQQKSLHCVGHEVSTSDNDEVIIDNDDNDNDYEESDEVAESSGSAVSKSNSMLVLSDETELTRHSYNSCNDSLSSMMNECTIESLGSAPSPALIPRVTSLPSLQQLLHEPLPQQSLNCTVLPSFKTLFNEYICK